MKSPGHLLSLKIRQFFRYTGVLVYRKPAPFFFIPVIVTIFSILGLIRFHEENRIWYLYSPSDADSHFEHAVANEFFNDRGGKFWLEVTITAKDMGNLLRREYLDDVDSLSDYLQYNLTIKCDYKSKTDCSFQDLCTGQCSDNKVIPLFNLIYRNESSRLHPNFRLTYPTMHLYNDEYYVGEHFAGVDIDPRTNVISSVKVIVLYFRTDRQSANISALINRWEQNLFDYSEHFNHPNLNITVNSDTMIAREVRTNGLSCLPYFSISVMLVVIFIFVSNRTENFVLSHSIFMSILGIAGPLMAIGTTFGFMFLFGYPFNSICLVMPFLVIGVGCDDVFIIIHAMRKTNKDESLEDQIAETMEEAGPSITVTSATNILSFGIGILTPTPAISLFCFYTCVAVAVDFIYQLTFFVAALVYAEKRLIKMREEKDKINNMEKSSNDKKNSDEHGQKKNFNMKGFIANYCLLLKDNRTRVSLIFILLVYWSISLWGCFKMEIKMDTSNLVLKDSPLNNIVYIYQKYLWSEGQLVFVFVNNPPDLRHVRNQQEVLELVNRFETQPYSMGKNSTSIWLRSFLHESSLYNQMNDFYKLLDEWLQDEENGGSRWNDMLRLKRNPNGTTIGIEKFMFATACAMGKDANWSTREKLQKQWRKVAEEYNHFNVTVFQAYSFYVDQLDSIAGTTMSTIVVAAITMDLACFLMIPSVYSVFTSSIAMISINIGVFGLLSVWNVNLDPITMCTTLMSIGFSVDFTAHISYHYYRDSKMFTTVERLSDALKGIGWPMIQAATSTLLCVSPLLLNDSYMVGVFVKTIFLVTTLGIVHGILFLPALLLCIGNTSDYVDKVEKPPSFKTIKEMDGDNKFNNNMVALKERATG